MITPQDKAKELFNKYYDYKWMSYRGKKQLFTSLPKFAAKQCALIAVDEIIRSSPSLPILGDSGTYAEDIELNKKYWQQVKTEIENL